MAAAELEQITCSVKELTAFGYVNCNNLENQSWKIKGWVDGQQS